MEFQNSSNNTLSNYTTKTKGKLKKAKDSGHLTSLQTLKSLDSPYDNGNGRGLVQEKDRTIIL